MRSIWLSFAVCVAVLFGIGCGTRQRPCVSTGVCGEGNLCVAGACRPKGGTVASATTRKLVLTPADIAVVAGNSSWTGADVPFGRKSVGRVTLLMKFAAPFAETTDIAAAVLVLEPMPGEESSERPVAVDLARVLTPWRSTDLSYGRMPSIAAADSTIMASTWASRTLYIDVTSQVRRWREHRSDDQGLALVASPSETRGASYSLGLTGATGPRLEIYVR